MRVIKSENIKFFDIDGTLILPYTTGPAIYVYDAVTRKDIKMQAHEPNVRLLLEEKHRGSTIIVWSMGGYEWAANVVRALNLVTKVDFVMSKPLAYFDDVPIDEWLRFRVFLDPNMKYKR